jgi:3-deoxy-manno-octulosonate cytidylyltransferase (CMP-KDO synthetase)
MTISPMISPMIPPCHGIIPARYDSTRFPGKPLADINGKPMFWHVYNRAVRCDRLAGVTIATDDARIADAAHRLQVPVVMTGRHHQSGTDRVKEAADILQIPENAVVVNIQGDEPLLEPEMLAQLVAPFENPEIQVSTLAHPLDPIESDNPDRVKVVLGHGGRALYFSRSPIPYYGQSTDSRLYYGHIGLYAFRKKTLDHFVSLPAGRLEQIEKLEQLRLLENDIPIFVAMTSFKSISVDRPEDLNKVIGLLNMTL